MLSKIKKSVRLYLGKHFPRLLVTLLYRKAFGKWLDWKNPKTLNEKIHWLKFFSDTSSWTILADKYRVRHFIEERGCAELLVKLYGVWKRPMDIDWSTLPNQFVMKTNGGSGDVRICYDKSQIDVDEWGKYYENFLNVKWGYQRGEPHYNDIKPVIIAEELLDISKQPIKTSSLIDYKIWCFNGIPHHIWACYNRTKSDVEVAVYDENWNYHPEASVFTKHYKESSMMLPRPKSLEKMIEYAKILSAGMPQVRVDFYEVDDKVYFGEMTMTGGGAFMDWYTQEYLIEMGSLIDISKEGKCHD